jgi:hypothetical protein
VDGLESRHCNVVRAWPLPAARSPTLIRQVAAWAGHSVAVLLRVYAHALDDQEGLSKRRIAAALDQSWTQIGHGEP